MPPSILLIDPPFFSFLNESQRGIPLGLAYLASSLKAEGYHDVKILNADIGVNLDAIPSGKNRHAEVQAFDQFERRMSDIHDHGYQFVIDTINKEQPSVIGITVRTAKYFITKQLVHRIKQEFPHIFIVIGGPHASSKPQDLLINMEVDVVVRGEGEVTFVELIKKLDKNEDYRQIAGISYMQGDQVVNNPMRQLVIDIDDIPLADRDVVMFSEQCMSADDMGLLFSSRGCPYGCSFCDSRGTWTRRVRRMSHDLLVKDIWDIKNKYGTSFFSFQDDCLVTKESTAIEMCDAFKASGLAALPRSEFRWWCEIHPNVITENLVKNMKEAGCVAIAIGAESGSQRSLKKVAKGASLDSIRKAAHAIRSADLSLTMFFIIGFPWETEQDILDTLQFMEEMEPDHPALSVLTPLPGTPIFDYCVEEGLISSQDADYRSHFHQRADGFYNNNIPQDRAVELIQEGFKRCNQVKELRKTHRLIDFFNAHLKNTLTEKFELLVAEDSKKSTEGLDGAMPRNLLIDQDWESESLKLEVRAQLNDQDMNDKNIIQFIESSFLEKFPEYKHVSVAITPA